MWETIQVPEEKEAKALLAAKPKVMTPEEKFEQDFQNFKRVIRFKHNLSIMKDPTKYNLKFEMRKQIMQNYQQ